MTVEPKELRDNLRHHYAQNQINNIGDDACVVIGLAMGWTMSMVSNFPSCVRQHLHDQNNEILEADKNK